MAKLETIEGIGPVYAAKLREAGIASLEALLQAGAGAGGRRELAEKTGIGHEYILDWVNRADLMRIKGIGEEYSDLLEWAGVDTVVELAQRNPDNLYGKLQQINQEKTAGAARARPGRSGRLGGAGQKPAACGESLERNSGNGRDLQPQYPFQSGARDPKRQSARGERARRVQWQPREQHGGEPASASQKHGGPGNRVPAETLRRASRVMQTQGHGGTSQYYAHGLTEAAGQLEDQPNLDAKGVTSVLQSLLSAVPAEGHPESVQPGGSVLEQLAGLAGGAHPAAQAPSSEPAGGLLGQLLGIVGGEPKQPAQADEEGADVGDLLSTLLPAGLAFLQAKQTGADTQAAATQALLAGLVSRQADPLQAPTARSAAAGLVARSFCRPWPNNRACHA